ncbi:SHOCT domain-containing protein [Mangrovicoccus ximenensis]|uniref:SHOCT domain-containing protein n=1 Tax=Mangrovicoccus ximenensis TaxID=1911570 RepID=UPI000D371E4C|nr:SHOCT domain-containing protein [Mangrovicoccus ximenensis]
MKRFVLPLSVMASPALADPEGYGHMMDWGYGYGMGMMFGPVLWLIVLGLVVAGVIWAVRRFDGPAPQRRKPDALAELDMRLARGEIDAEDYAARRKLLAG